MEAPLKQPLNRPLNRPLQNRFLFVTDPSIVNTLCEHILTSEFPSAIGIDTETAQYSSKYTSESLTRPPFDTLQICFDGDLGLRELTWMEVMECFPMENGSTSPSSVSDIDFLISTTLVISMTAIWEEWRDSCRAEISGIPKGNPHSSLLSVLMRSGNRPTKENSVVITIPFCDHLNRKVPRLIELMCDPSIVKIGCALENDLTEFEGLLGKPVPATIDIQTLAKSLGWPEISLDNLSKRCLGKGKFKVNILSNWGSTSLPRELIQYAAGDSVLTLRVYQALLGALPHVEGSRRADILLDVKKSSLPSSMIPQSPSATSVSLSLSSSLSRDFQPLPIPLFYRRNDQKDVHEPKTLVRYRMDKANELMQKTNESLKVVNHLRKTTIFQGKHDPHISKVIKVIESGYSPWVQSCSKAERRKKANETIEQLIDQEILYLDSVLRTLSFNKAELSGRDQEHVSKRSLSLCALEGQGAIRYLKGIFPSTAYPSKVVNVIENRYCTGELFSKYSARAFLARLIERGEVLETPAGMIFIS